MSSRRGETNRTPTARLPACDPCRASKLACDHSQPVCARCSSRSMDGECRYRPLPFRKTKTHHRFRRDANASRQRQYLPDSGVLPVNNTVNSVAAFASPSQPYPNPGYLGSSSYTTLFENITPNEQLDSNTSSRARPSSIVFEPTASEAQILYGAELIEQVYRLAHLPTCMNLVKDWLATGSNLHLAEYFTYECIQSIKALMIDIDRHSTTAVSISTALFTHSCREFTVGQATTQSEFRAQFTGQKARWETLCLFFIAVCRATMWRRCSDGTSIAVEQQQKLRRLAMHFADRFLDISLALDRLDDLQLILQYENFISHSLVDGDQSFEAWRRLGDVVSSLFALGYHQNIVGPRPIPGFLKELRQATFACSYSADKNVSVFLGRPPRINLEVCQFQSLALDRDYTFEWQPDTPLNLMADTRWTTICAALKEEALKLSRVASPVEKSQKASILKGKAEAQWSALPDHFRLNGPMKEYDCSAKQLDMMLSAKLNFLHVLFLLHLAVAQRVTDPDPEIISVASDMLSLVIEAMMMKDRLVSSGTSLVWKVVYYGLSAAGLICLALLRQSSNPGYHGMNNPRVLRDLAVLVGDVELGTLVYKEDANYALLAEATGTIRNLYDRLISSIFDVAHSSQSPGELSATTPVLQNEEDWRHGIDHGFQEFEVNFWQNLLEHPLLTRDTQI